MGSFRLVFILLFFGLSGMQAWAQRSFALKSNLHGLFAGRAEMGIEKSISEHLSVELALGAGGSGRNWDDVANVFDYGRRRLLVEPGIRYYPDLVLDGVYVRAFGLYKMKKEMMDDLSNVDLDVSFTDTESTVGFGVGLGYQFVLRQGFVIDFSMNPLYRNVSRKLRVPNSPDLNQDVSTGTLNENPLALKVVFGLGIAL